MFFKVKDGRLLIFYCNVYFVNVFRRFFLSWGKWRNLNL